MTNLFQNMAGMGNMTEQVVATDFLLASKAAIKCYAVAICEVATPEVRNALKIQLNDAINTHEQITNYMMSKGYYYAYTPEAQFKLDMETANKVLQL